jgi:hypothetical protein
MTPMWPKPPFHNANIAIKSLLENKKCQKKKKNQDFLHKMSISLDNQIYN